MINPANRESGLGRIARVTLTAIALVAASQVGVRPPDISAQMLRTSDRQNTANKGNNLVYNSADCIQFGVTQGKGPIEGSMSMSVHRFYTEVDKEGAPVRDITEELKTSSDIYDDLDARGNKVDTVQGLERTFSDWKVSVVNGDQSEIIRARFPENQEDTQAYWLRRGPVTWDNVGEAMRFRSDRVDGKVKVKNNCGVDAEVDGFMVKKVRMLADGASREVKNAIQWIGRNCRFRDAMTQEHALRLPDGSETMTPLVSPPGEPYVPPAPAQVPGRRTNVPAPAQVPEK